MRNLYVWIEAYLFYPISFSQKLLSFFLLPLSAVYCTVVYVKRFRATPRSFAVPVVSVGNIIVGGSGKTPFTVAISKEYANACVVLRGYGRSSYGCIVISQEGKIREDVSVSGDEAMLYATSLPNASVIVSEDRGRGIEKAKALGAKVVFLDDGFSKAHIEKFDILLKNETEPTNTFCLPSGGYREPYSRYTDADLVAQEGEAFTRHVRLDAFEKAVLISAISKPERLERYIDARVVAKEYFPDHHVFREEEIDAVLKKHGVSTILTTEKDYVKLSAFDYDIKLMHLDVVVDESVKTEIKRYVDGI